jgi:hypothetical protein
LLDQAEANARFELGYRVQDEIYVVPLGSPRSTSGRSIGASSTVGASSSSISSSCRRVSSDPRRRVRVALGDPSDLRVEAVFVGRQGGAKAGEYTLLGGAGHDRIVEGAASDLQAIPGWPCVVRDLH